MDENNSLKAMLEEMTRQGNLLQVELATVNSNYQELQLKFTNMNKELTKKVTELTKSQADLHLTNQVLTEKVDELLKINQNKDDELANLREIGEASKCKEKELQEIRADYKAKLKKMKEKLIKLYKDEVNKMIAEITANEDLHLSLEHYKLELEQARQTIAILQQKNNSDKYYFHDSDRAPKTLSESSRSTLPRSNDAMNVIQEGRVSTVTSTDVEAENILCDKNENEYSDGASENESTKCSGGKSKTGDAHAKTEEVNRKKKAADDGVENDVAPTKKVHNKPKPQTIENMKEYIDNNSIEKLTTTTLLHWLREKYLPCTTRDKKAELIQKVKDHFA